MHDASVLVGSLSSLGVALATPGLVELDEGADVVLLPTAAAFVGPRRAGLELLDVVEPYARGEVLMVTDRTGAQAEYPARRVAEADLVVLADGSALHARSVWRESPVGAAIARAHQLIAIGETGSALFDVMVDPRGGAPTSGLGYRHDLVLTRPAPRDQLTRTRALLGATHPLVVLGDSGIVAGHDTTWRVVAGEVQVSRGVEPASL